MCWRQLVLIGLLVSSCREIEPVSPGQVFSGYQINGIVTNASGIPLEGIELRLFYEYGVRYPAQDTAQLFVSDSVNTIQAEVFDGEARLVRSFSIARFTGYLRRKIWDEKDSTSQSVKSGLYTIIVYF